MVKLDTNLLLKLQEIEGPSYTKILFVDNKIYGSGGWHRYYINWVYDGEKLFDKYEVQEVLFSAFHSDLKGIEKARKAGFNIFN